MKKILLFIFVSTIVTSCVTFKPAKHRNQWSCPVVMLDDSIPTNDEQKVDTTFNWYAGRHY